MRTTLQKILNIYILQIFELLITLAILIISFSNIKEISGSEFSKIILPENIKYLSIFLLATTFFIYLLEFFTRIGWLRIPYFIIILIVILVMLIDKNKDNIIININIAIAIASIVYFFILLTLIIYEIVKKISKKKNIM